MMYQNPSDPRARLAKLRALAERPGTRGEGEAARARIDALLRKYPELSDPESGPVRVEAEAHHVEPETRPYDDEREREEEIARRYRRPKRTYSDRVDLAELCKMFDLPNFDDFEFYDDSYSEGYKSGIAEGMTEEEAEEEGARWEQEEQDEAYRNWYDATIFAIEQAFEKCGLELEGKGDRRPWEFRVVPEKSWEDAWDAIQDVLRGVGAESGYEGYRTRTPTWRQHGYPSVRAAVLANLNQIPLRAEVYGDPSARRVYESRMR